MEAQQLAALGTRSALPASEAAVQPSAPAPGAGKKMDLVKDASDLEAPNQAGGTPTPSQLGDAGQADDELNANLADLEAPYFQPYWSPAFFVTAIGAIVMIWAFCWLYVGAFWNPTTRLPNLHVAVLDCDVVPPAASLNASFAPLLPSLVPVPVATGLLAASVWNASSPLSGALHWVNGSCGGGNTTSRCGSPEHEAACVAALSDDVRQGGAWVLLYFPSNFTASYLSWYPSSGVVPQYKRPTGQYVYARGRDFSTYNYLSAIILTTMLPGLSGSFTSALAANPQVMKALSPSFLATGISIQQIDLAPVRNFGQHFASYIFCVLLWLGSSFVVVSSYQFKLPAEAALLDPRWSERRRVQAEDRVTGAGGGAGGGSGSGPMVRLRHVAWALMVKALVASVFMFGLMVLLCVVLWALGRGNEQWFYNAGYAMAFGWYMSWSFVSINAVLLHVIGIERFSSMTALLLIVQLTASSGIMSIELANRFFYIGKGLPFYYGVRGFRTIFFGTCENKMYINWLVFTAYNVAFIPLGLLLVAHRVWSTPQRAHKQHRSGNAAGVGEIALPVAAGFA